MIPSIQVEGLRKSYGSTRAVDGLSFEVAQGEFFGLLGPNGAGKTTTLEIVEGLRRPDEGLVRVMGLSPHPRNPQLLPLIGVQLQTSAFFERLTVREQIHAFAKLYRIPPRVADATLERVGLDDRADIRTEQLSGGQAQRLSIACALVHNPQIVFLDEPTSGLDPRARRNLWNLLRTINAQGRTVVLTTHYMEEAEALCDRVAIVDRGRILECGSPDAIVRSLNAPTEVTVEGGRMTLDDARRLFPFASVRAEDASLVISTHDPASVLASLAQYRMLHGLTVRSATLDDVFLNLTGQEQRS